MPTNKSLSLFKVSSTSFIFTWTAVNNNAFEICRNVKFCCPRKYETWRQNPWIIEVSPLQTGNLCLFGRFWPWKILPRHLKLPCTTFYGNLAEFSFVLQNLHSVPKNSFPRKFTCIWQFEQIGIIATIKFIKKWMKYVNEINNNTTTTCY